MEPIILKIELSAAPELMKALNGLSALATALIAKQCKSDQETSGLSSSNLEAVTNRAKELIASGKKKEVAELLNEYGVKKATDLNPCLYKDFLDKSQNIL